MGLDSIWHWLILLVIIVVIFGAGKLTRLGPDLGNAVRGFKKALNGEDEAKPGAPRSDEQLRADPPPAAGTGEQARERDHADPR